MKRTTWQKSHDGTHLIVPPPILRQVRDDQWEYSFSLWMERSQGAPLLLHSLIYSVNRPLDGLKDFGTPALSAMIVPAMRMGLPLTVEAPVSARYLFQLKEFQEIQSTWIPDMKQVIVTAPAMALPTANDEAKKGVGSFFSLGVDGFHAFRQHADSITDLIFIHGFDIELDRQAHRSAVHSGVEEAARELVRKLINVQTNIRSFCDHYLWWGHVCGSALATVGQLLSPHLQTVYIASSSTYDNFVPFGTTALADPLFSTEAVEFIHYGCDVTRSQKTEQIVADPVVMKHLRVCWEMEGSAQNCGRCDKCLRTMTSLLMLGVLDKAPTFSAKLDPEIIRKRRLNTSQLTFLREQFNVAKARGMENHPVMQAWAEAAAKSNLPLSAELDAATLAALSAEERDQLFADLRQAHPQALNEAAAAYAPRIKGEVFDFLWKHHRKALWRAIRKGNVR